MIEKATVDGAEVSVAFLTADFQPTTREGAALIKVIYPDGRSAFVAPAAAIPVDAVAP